MVWTVQVVTPPWVEWIAYKGHMLHTRLFQPQLCSLERFRVKTLGSSEMEEVVVC